MNPALQNERTASRPFRARHVAEGELEPGDPVDWRKLQAVAAQRFGIKHFRPGQRELIECVLARRNAFGILPTGAGKSLCYQLPALFLRGLVVVVSPLIALMQDQHERLEEADIEAARLDSTLTEREQKEEEHETRRGAHDIVLVTPERLQNPKHLEPLKRRGVALFVVDEAHCVSQWGHDFRPAYLQLRPVIEALGRPTVLALTATAPPERVQDILTSLGIPDARVVQGGIERENLFLEVFRTVNREEKQQRLMQILDETPGSGIIYAATVRRVEELHAWLIEHGVDAARYHGQLKTSEREQAQQRFMSGQCRLIVATNAFGLGVDKADVRFVVHWNFPDSVESYYQEAGRAGRDGKPARCALLYRLEDKRVRSFFLGGKHPRADDVRRVLHSLSLERDSKVPPMALVAEKSGLSERRVAVITAALENMDVLGRKGRQLFLKRSMTADEVQRFLVSFDERYEADRARLRSIMQYGETTLCRTQFMREYFGEEPGDRCEHCDNCREGAAEPTAIADQSADRRARRRTDSASSRRRSGSRAQRVHERERDVARSLPSPDSGANEITAAVAFSPGEKVRHAKFGTGEVLESEGDKLRVQFIRAGERWVVASYLKPMKDGGQRSRAR